MGAWGYKLYQCDDARDFKEEFKSVKNFPFSQEQFIKYFKDSLGYLQGDKQTIQWLVLYDQLHQHGITAPEIFDQVTEIIRNGEDIDFHRELGMTERDLKKRAAHLDSLLQSWQIPAPKPKKRKIIAADAPFLLDIANVYIYPTNDGWPRTSTYEWSTAIIFDPGKKGQAVPEVDLTEWAAFIVLARQKTADIIPQYIILRLKLKPGPKRTSLADIKRAYVAAEMDNRHFYNTARHQYLEPKIHHVETSTRTLNHLRIERIGAVSLDTEALICDLKIFQANQFWRWRTAEYQRYKDNNWPWPGDPPPSKPYIDDVYAPAEMTLSRRKELDEFLQAGDIFDKDEWRVRIVEMEAFPLKKYLTGTV